MRRPTPDMIMQFPHCDARILHAPSDCQYCDDHPDWQDLRVEWGINFTGHNIEGLLPCPADARRGDGHMNWGGNLPHQNGEVVHIMPDDDVIEQAVAATKRIFEENDA